MSGSTGYPIVPIVIPANLELLILQASSYVAFRRVARPQAFALVNNRGCDEQVLVKYNVLYLALTLEPHPNGKNSEGSMFMTCHSTQPISSILRGGD